MIPLLFLLLSVRRDLDRFTHLPLMPLLFWHCLGLGPGPEFAPGVFLRLPPVSVEIDLLRVFNSPLLPRVCVRAAEADSIGAVRV